LIHFYKRNKNNFLMQRFPSHGVPFPQWQQGMEPNGKMNQKRAVVQLFASTQGPRPRQQSLLPFPSQNGNQGLQTMKNGNGMQKVRIQNNIVSSHHHRKKVGSHKWTKIGGMINQDNDLQGICNQDPNAYGQQMQLKQQNSQTPKLCTLKIQRSSNSGPSMLNSSGPFERNNSGPFAPNNISPFMQNNSGPSMQNYSGPSMQNNSGPFGQNNFGSFLQRKRKNSDQFMHNSDSLIQNNQKPIIQPLIQINSGQFMQNNIVPSFKNNNSQFLQNKNDEQFMENNNGNPLWQNNNIPFSKSMQYNRNPLETGQNKPDSDVEILTSTPRENEQSNDKLSPFKNTFGSKSGWQSSNYTENCSKINHKKPKSQAFKQQQKILMLQKELSGKNIEMNRFSKEVEELKEKTAEVMKGNKHLVEVIKKKDLELESNQTLIIDMKAEIKRAQKEVLNCLQKKVAKSQEALKMDPVQTNEQANIEVQNKTTDLAVENNEKNLADDHTSSSLCLKIKSFLEFNGLAQKISTSIEKTLDIDVEDKCVLTNLKLGRQDVESAISSFQDDVLNLFDELTSVIKNKVEVEISLADIEKNIEHKQVKLVKITTNIEGLLKKVKTLSKKDLKTSVEAHALRGELESVKTELEKLRKHHRKLEIDNKRVVNKLNVITNDLNLNIEIL